MNVGRNRWMDGWMDDVFNGWMDWWKGCWDGEMNDGTAVDVSVAEYFYA